ncbi:hypothetical protein GMOD_00007447 [Pyrenophora seminiperda CCB06]|uniref:Uncharacterized protein n=1 Tax=Pyrenophora seminiperda CCB06 TaxID=1302712 RepID=A0A3M7MDI6_9PLEO|nr:hypothetical protein GMOD_00007447 [Pyrenophora seminiperda CCB06]
MSYPKSDTSILDVELNAEFWVRQLVVAMINLEDVKDTDNSSAVQLFDPEEYDSLLLEAVGREIFLALIDRCKNGFRGPCRCNKALEPNGGLEADVTASCAERMQNVVSVLSCNKRVAEDMLFDSWKIRLLVNHPLAYDNDDEQEESDDQRRRRLEFERDRLKRIEEELLIRRANLLNYTKE